MLGVGEVLPFSPTRRRAASLPVDVARTIEEALTNLRLDVVHVHEPFAPSASSVALRHSRALNVGGFHGPTERVLSTQLARPLSRLFFGRLDARTASYEATRELMQRFFPADYRVILPGADVETDADGIRPRPDRGRARRARADRARGARGPADLPAGATRAAGGPGLARHDLVAAAADGLGGARQGPARTRRVRRPQPAR